MSPIRRFYPLSLLIALVFVLTGCGSSVDEESRTVGGSCDSHSDCRERCLQDDFPGGMCTVTCDGDEDCPVGSSCTDVQDGVCLMECSEDRDCPGGYECDDKHRHGHGGKVDVCVED